MAEGTTLTWMSCGHVSVTNMIDIDHLLNILSTFFIILIHFVAILSILGPRDVVICGLAQYAMLWGTMIGYTITTATSIMWEFYLTSLGIDYDIYILHTIMQNFWTFGLTDAEMVWTIQGGCAHQLLPLQRPRCELRCVGNLIHGPVRTSGDCAVTVSELGEDHTAVGNSCGDVVYLLIHRIVLEHSQVCFTPFSPRDSFGG